jgi:YD repeat-containing protein
MNSYNALENSDFSRSITGWSLSNAVSGDGAANSRLMLMGNQGVNKNAYQKVPINKKDVGFYVQGLAAAPSVPMTGGGRYFALDLGIVYADGTPTEWKVVDFNPDVSATQATSEMVAPSKANRGKVIDHVEYYVIYYRNSNQASFDNLMLNIDENGTTYDYDAKGNVISSKENAKREETYTLDNATNLVTQATDQRNDKYSYNYTSANHRALRSAKENSTGIGVEYGYTTNDNIYLVQMGKVGAMTTNKWFFRIFWYKV